MAQPFLGQIQMWGTTFSPMFWTDCSGQLMPISQNTALFSIIGNYYGGDGRTTMGVPALNGRAPMHSGTGPGLYPRILSNRYGETTVVLTESTMPSHSHGGVYCYTNIGDQTKFTHNPANAVPAVRKDDIGSFDFAYKEYSSETGYNMGIGTVSAEGATAGHENRQPLLTLRFCLALDGIYPPRS